MAPLVSVIIPTFNRAALLQRTIYSVRSQTFQDFEIIVVNDGSTDGTGKWLAKQPDLRVLSQENKGIATSRNNGAAIARGEWLAFLDHDDLWAPTKLRVQVQFIMANPDVALVAAKHVTMGRRFRTPLRPVWIKGDLLVKAYTESFIHTSSVMMRKDVFHKVGGFSPEYKFADEFDVWLKVAKDYVVAYVNEPLVFIRLYDSNTSHNRMGLRTETQDILLKHYAPNRIPLSSFLKTMSDHDISFGRACLKENNLTEAVKWFRRSLQRTPLRPRSWRYFIRYRIAQAFMRKVSHGTDT